MLETATTLPKSAADLLPKGRQVDFSELPSPTTWKPEFATPFNQRVIGKKILISNDFGDWLLLAKDEFRDLIEGRPQPGQPLYEKLKRANFVALMDGLEARGLADRRKGGADRRSHALHLTPEGERFVRKMLAVWHEHEDRMVDRLGGPQERDRLIELLDRLLAGQSAEKED